MTKLFPHCEISSNNFKLLKQTKISLQQLSKHIPWIWSSHRCWPADVDAALWWSHQTAAGHKHWSKWYPWGTPGYATPGIYMYTNTKSLLPLALQKQCLHGTSNDRGEQKTCNTKAWQWYEAVKLMKYYSYPYMPQYIHPENINKILFTPYMLHCFKERYCIHMHFRLRCCPCPVL